MTHFISRPINVYVCDFRPLLLDALLDTHRLIHKTQDDGAGMFKSQSF